MYMRAVIYIRMLNDTITIYFNMCCVQLLQILTTNLFFLLDVHGASCPIYPFYLRVKKIINLHIVLE